MDEPGDNWIRQAQNVVSWHFPGFKQTVITLHKLSNALGDSVSRRSGWSPYMTGK